LTLTVSNTTIEFTRAGAGNGLEGAWTRSKNKEESCGLRSYLPGIEYYTCDQGYDIVKIVFTGTEIAITREVCDTDRINDEEFDGNTVKVIDCDKVEYSKGTEKIIMDRSEPDTKYTYNGSTCIQYSSYGNGPVQIAACQEFANSGSFNNAMGISGGLNGFLNDKFRECAREKGFPADFEI
jgi:hypothetical protein